MTLKEHYRYFLEKLTALYPSGEAATITEWVFEKTAALKKADVLKTPERPIPTGIELQLQQQLGELLQHRPVQYVLGEAWFAGMRLMVNESVLIPRPETEELVQQVSARLFENAKVLDVGTGSGCIALALKKNCPNAIITAIDLSGNALTVALQNSINESLDVNFIQMDVLKKEESASLPKFDFIVSNPPYIPMREKGEMDAHVTHYEPHLALFVPNERPLLFYEALAELGRTHLNEGGNIWVETHESMAQITAALFEEQYDQVEIHTDLFGKERMVSAVY